MICSRHKFTYTPECPYCTAEALKERSQGAYRPAGGLGKETARLQLTDAQQDVIHDEGFNSGIRYHAQCLLHEFGDAILAARIHTQADSYLTDQLFVLHSALKNLSSQTTN